AWTIYQLDGKRLWAEKNANDQKTLLQSIIDNLGEGLVVADPDGKFVLFNPAAEVILGLGHSEKVPDQWTHHYGLFKMDQKTPFPQDEIPLVRAIHGEVCDDVEMFVRNPKIPEGTFISVSGRPIRSDSGEIQGGVVVFYDISDRLKADDAMRQ